MHSLIDSLMNYFGTIGYLDIFILMTLESSIVPVPSELVMIPAGISALWGNINPFVATIIGWLGSVLWALLNYYILGKYLGKPFLEKYGKYILITHTKYKRAEDLFLQNDKVYTFIGRFIPVVRHLISIPAGIFEMKLVPFVSLTFLGATLWCAVLVALGYFFWDSMTFLIGKYSNEIWYISVVLIGIYLWYKIFKK